MKKIMFDVGANDGNSSIDYAINHNFIVYAFEPIPLMANEIRNKVQYIKDYFVIQKAVSDFNGISNFNISGVGGREGTSSLLEFSEKSSVRWPGRNDFYVSSKIEVETIKLSSFINENNIEVIDYLHIDTQGNDLKVLQGLEDKIKLVKRGVVEAAYEKDILYFEQNTVEDTVAFLEKNNFLIESIQQNDPFMNEANIYFTSKN